MIEQYDPCFIQNVRVNSLPLIAFALRLDKLGLHEYWSMSME